MKKKILTTLSILAVIAVTTGLFLFLNVLLAPKYAETNVEGSMISQYYREDKHHDVIFIGDCEVYANFSPMEMYREKGITAYVRGTSQQLLWQSWSVLEETLTYETPKVVVFNVNAMRYDAPVKEEYNRLTIDKMRWSIQKVDIIQSSMTEEEDFLSYVFPILRYHDRFDKLTQEDFTYLFKEKDNTHNGHLINQSVKPMKNLPVKRKLPNYQFGDICYDYLEKMTALCKEKGVELILIKAPSQYPFWYEEYDAQISEFAKKHELCYYDFTKVTEEIGLDFQTDTYDAGKHLNLAGATKMSKYFATILAEKHGIPDRRNDPAVAEIYREKLIRYDEAIKEGKDSCP
ncbi:MAG: SGNH/GDSL hydrolase family protein [Oscillospiraceae bacterium]|nr:SGNH/GDSL hydrolase family protein [Oscillospiraceae bacterium]